MKINHIGIVVKNLEKAANYYCQNFEYKIKVANIIVKNQDVEITILESTNCNNNIELIRPLSDLSPSYKFMKSGGGLNHICFETNKYNELLLKLDKKIVKKSMDTPVELFGGGRTFFIYDRHQLIEFLEVK